MIESSPAGRDLWNRTSTPGEFELYDLKDDPGELADLAGKANCREIQERLKSELFTWRRKVVRDPLLDPAVLEEFTAEYRQHCREWTRQHEKIDKKVMEKTGWHPDQERWIPPWNPDQYLSQ